MKVGKYEHSFDSEFFGVKIRFDCAKNAPANQLVLDRNRVVKLSEAGGPLRGKEIFFSGKMQISG